MFVHEFGDTSSRSGSTDEIFRAALQHLPGQASHPIRTTLLIQHEDDG
jgi:hypothetical protein